MSALPHEQVSVVDFAHNSYLNYSMYVILDRALPHIGDGLKPVHRRILYAMNELHLNAKAKYKKSARTVGDVLGKYHPHGDSACYEAMVLMAQDFMTRNPLVDGQGNWGSLDEPKSFAAMRYTEAKLTAYSDAILENLKYDTVDWRTNFDGTMKEPEVLPSPLPNILINGTFGIAVGISTSIPPHNIDEVTNACIAIMQKKRITDDEILSHVIAPDYPSGGEIVMTQQQIYDVYKAGSGRIILRAEYEVTDNNEIIITSIPYQVPANRVIEEIAQQADDKKFNLIKKIKDDSDKHTPFKLILTLASKKTDPDLVMSHLYNTTSLQKNQKVNLNVIGLDKAPQNKSLPTILREWCLFRQDIFERKKKHRLAQIEKRVHILHAFLVVYGALDQVIQIIRESDEPKNELMTIFSLTEIQVDAILELKMRQLAKLEEMKLQQEFDTLSTEITNIKTLLADEQKIKRAIIKELKTDSQRFTTPRRTKLLNIEYKKQATYQESKPITPLTIVLSENGWIRSLQGHDIAFDKLTYKSGDQLLSTITTSSDQSVILMDTSGRFYALPSDTLPNGKTMGEPLSTRLTVDPQTPIKTLLSSEPTHYLLTTRNGNGFKVPTKTLLSRNKTGKEVLKLTPNDSALTPLAIEQQTHIALLTQANRLLIVALDEVNISNKSQGIRLVNLNDDNDCIADIKLITLSDTLTIFAGAKKYLIKEDELAYYCTKRARKGNYFKHRGNAALSFSL